MNKEQSESRSRIAELQRQASTVCQQQDELLNLRLLGEIDTDIYGRKSMELRDREARINLQIESASRGRHENADLAVKAFELSQSLEEKWFTADYATKRRCLELVVLNFSLVDVSLVPVWRKPFDMLAKGLFVQQSRGDWI